MNLLPQMQLLRSPSSQQLSTLLNFQLLRLVFYFFFSLCGHNSSVKGSFYFLESKEGMRQFSFGIVIFKYRIFSWILWHSTSIILMFSKSKNAFQLTCSTAGRKDSCSREKIIQYQAHNFSFNL